MSYQNIPLELRERRQWVVWREEVAATGRTTKVPYTPDGSRASVTDPAHWLDFATATALAKPPLFQGIGFVLTESDPYCIIDLDNKITNPIGPEEWATHQKILESIDTYTERSYSRRGYHIVCRGRVYPGRRRGNVEIYSAERYMAFTGDVLRNSPISDAQRVLDLIVAEMPSDTHGAGALTQQDSEVTDAALVQLASNAKNGDKFNRLCAGDWSGLGYPSQSEADYALMSMLAFYSRDNEQCRRVFRMTGLGKRDKATQNDKYLNRILVNMRAKEPLPSDFEQARKNAEALLAAAQKPAEPEPEPLAPQPRAPGAPFRATVATLPKRAEPDGRQVYSFPPGLVGEVAKYVLASATRPIPEVALCTSIAFLSGIVGRCYNISGTGLNQYVLLLARTGSGKEAAAKGISKLTNAVRQSVPMIDEFAGPAAFSSGQALVRLLDTRPSFTSVMGEFGMLLQQLNNPRASSSDVMLKRVILDLYAKSGWDDVLQSTAYSDSDKNTKAVRAPNVTILGEATPETFYDAIGAADIADGLIPRFHVVEYKGERPSRNRDANHAPPADLVRYVATITTQALTMRNNSTCAPVQTDHDALTLLDAFDEKCDGFIRHASNQGEAQLWNRAHLKALKLSALVAVGFNWTHPVVTADLARWAINFTEHSTNVLLLRFARGDIGIGDSKQMSDVRRLVQEYFAHGSEDLKKYKVKPLLQVEGLIPYNYLVVRCSRLASFSKDRAGAARALRSTIETCVAAEILHIVQPQEAAKRYGLRQALYAVGPSF